MLNRAKLLLSSKLLENITLLKMIDAYGDKLICRIIERDNKWGCLLTFPTQLSTYDRITYPLSKLVIFICGSDSCIVSDLLDELPDNEPLIFKIQREDYKMLIEKKFQLEKMRSFYSYTCTNLNENFKFEEAMEENYLKEDLVSLWTLNGYEIQDLEKMFKLGAKSYTIYKNGSPVCTCLTFSNYDKVWEVGAVYTIDEYRGKGYAKKVVSSAINKLLKRNLIPRYQVVDNNMASIRVAESLGLTRAVTLEHLFFRGRVGYSTKKNDNGTAGVSISPS